MRVPNVIVVYRVSPEAFVLEHYAQDVTRPLSLGFSHELLSNEDFASFGARHVLTSLATFPSRFAHPSENSEEFRRAVSDFRRTAPRVVIEKIDDDLVVTPERKGLGGKPPMHGKEPSCAVRVNG